MIVSHDIAQLSKLVGGEVLGIPKQRVKILSTDSRSLPYSEGVMFVAINGERHNGNKYIQEVYDKGVRSFLVDEKPELKLYPDAVFCLVDDSLKALQRIAVEQRKAFNGTVIGITGSNGKTIVKEWLYQALQQENNVVRSPRSYNSQLGVPLSIWPVTNQYDVAIIEAGISQRGEMKKLEKMISPHIGILTNLGPAHRENFSSDKEKLKEKLQLFKNSQKFIYRVDLNIDMLDITGSLDEVDAEKIGWSLEGEAKYSFHRKTDTEENAILELNYDDQEVQFATPFSDGASIENICHVIVCLLELGMGAEVIQKRISGLEPVEMRLQILKGIHGSTLVNDVYNSDLAGLNSAVDVLMQQRNHLKRAVILSDLFQSGMEEGDLYGEVSNLLKFKKIDQFYGIGPAITKHRHLFPAGAEFFSDTSSFLSAFSTSDITNYALLIKGARSFQMERITYELQLQVHQTILEIDVNALIDNLNYYRSIISPDTKMLVMVKALSYGSGSYEIAGLLQHQQVDYLAVAFSDEGVRLRQSRVKLPVMVMNSATSDYQQLIDNDLEPVIFNVEGLIKFREVCSFNGLENYPIHIKLDTGMHRLGFSVDEIAELCEKIDTRETKVKSVFSHLVGSDEEKFDEFSKEQAVLFVKMAETIIKKLGYSVMQHILNSAGTERFPEYHFNMVRIGIGLYGEGISKNLKQVSTFKTVISQIRKVKKVDTVGYSRNGKLLRDSSIAVIPVGYADGIDRRLGNGNISFFVKGKHAPTVGNICMDMTMIDVTSLDATVGDVVELFGKECPVSEIAERLDTISYEVLTSIPERVKRVYIRE
jgi:Alr-MurF fusion protein